MALGGEEKRGVPGTRLDQHPSWHRTRRGGQKEKYGARSPRRENPMSKRQKPVVGGLRGKGKKKF